jgi:MFS family permease
LISNYKPKVTNASFVYSEGNNEQVGLLNQSENVIHDQAEKNLPFRKIIFSKLFLTIYCMAFCHFVYGYFFTSAYKNYGKNYINDDHYLTLVGATSSLFNGFFKFVWGSLTDYYPFKRVYLLIVSIEILMIALVQFAVHEKWSFMIVS